MRRSETDSWYGRGNVTPRPAEIGLRLRIAAFVCPVGNTRNLVQRVNCQSTGRIGNRGECHGVEVPRR